MRTLIALACLGAAAGGAALLGSPFRCCEGASAASVSSPAELVGQYVEVRDASVFGGACHINGEFDLQGRRSLVAWRIEAGAFDGVDLARVSVVAAVASPENLDEGAERSSFVYVSEDASDEQQRAAVAWLRETRPELLGDVAGVAPKTIELTVDEASYRLAIADLVRVEGAALPDRACCTMPSSVWYEPLDRGVSGAVVGNSALCRFDGALDGWSYPEQNNSFIASFRERPSRAERGTSCCLSGSTP